MTPKPIRWAQHPSCRDICGFIGVHEVFAIKEKITTKTGILFVLYSVNIPNKLFYRTGEMKRLGEYESVDAAKETAETEWSYFVNDLLCEP